MDTMERFGTIRGYMQELDGVEVVEGAMVKSIAELQVVSRLVLR